MSQLYQGPHVYTRLKTNGKNIHLFLVVIAADLTGMHDC